MKKFTDIVWRGLCGIVAILSIVWWMVYTSSMHVYISTYIWEQAGVSIATISTEYTLSLIVMVISQYPVIRVGVPIVAYSFTGNLKWRRSDAKDC